MNGTFWALLLAFSTGTSWGTFAILLPIATAIFKDSFIPLTAITTAAILGGSVCGDHISPISDTTILSSTGAGCQHINHVATQMQYGLIATVISCISYIIAGLIESAALGLIVGFILLGILIWAIKLYYKRDN